MKKKLLVLGIASLFLLTSTVSLTAISITEEQVLSDRSSDSDEIQLLDENNEEEITETDIIEHLYVFLEKHLGKEISPAVKQVIQYAFTNAGGADSLLPGLYVLGNCNDIDIEGKGSWILMYNRVLVWVLDNGQADIDGNSFGYVSDEIMGFGVFIDFAGDLTPEDPPTGEEYVDITVTGSAFYGFLLDFSYLVEIYTEKETYKVGKPISIVIDHGKFIQNNDEIKIVDPHFIIMKYENYRKRYDEQVIGEFILPSDDKIIWYWTQEIPRGDYFVAAEFLINGRTHPSYFYGLFKIRYITGENEEITDPVNEESTLLELVQRSPLPEDSTQKQSNTNPLEAILTKLFTHRTTTTSSSNLLNILFSKLLNLR